MRILKAPIMLFLLFVIFTAIFLVPWIHGNDGAGYYSYVRSVFIDKNLDLKNEKDYFAQKFSVASIQQDNQTGVYYSQYPIGTALLWSPFFAIGHLIALITGSQTDGYSMPYVYMINFGSAILAFFGLLMSYYLCTKFFSKKIAFISIITFWLSSNLFYYMFFEASMSHACSFFAVSLVIYYWFKTQYLNDNATFAEWILLGLFSALMIMVRYQDGLFLLIPLIYTLCKYHQLFRQKSDIFRLLLKNIIFLASIFIGLIPQFLVLKYQHGTYFSALSNYQTSINLWNAFYNIINVLFSTNHGLFLWTPITLIGFLGLIFFAFKTSKLQEKQLSLALIIVFFAQTLFIASTAEWYGAQSYSHRMFMGAGIILIFGLCTALKWIEQKAGLKWAIALCTVFILWNFNLMAQYGLRMIPAEGAVNFKKIIENFIKVLPQKVITILKSLFLSKNKLIS